MKGFAAAAAGGSVRTGARLVTALLGYFGLVTLVITLSPFDFAFRPFGLFWKTNQGDLIANVALFLPIGFLLRSRGGGGRPMWRDVAAAAGFSLTIELAQTFIPGRYVAPFDLAANTCGAWIGIVARDLVERWSIWHPRVVGRIGLNVPLVGLLYLLVPQLWLSGVGMVDDPRRSVTTLLLGGAGSVVLVALHRHHWRGGVRLAANVVPPLAFLWFTVGALPTLATSPRSVTGMGLAIVGITWWLVRRQVTARERRFEIDTLSRFLPVFTVYVMVATLWPPFRPLVPWHGSIGFSDGLHGAAVIDLLLLLEQVGAFTILGYAGAEWRGRRELTLAADLARITPAAAMFALCLELVQGLLAGPGASLLRAGLAVAGAMYGAAVYHRARAHVRMLRAEHTAAFREHEAA